MRFNRDHYEARKCTQANANLKQVTVNTCSPYGTTYIQVYSIILSTRLATNRHINHAKVNRELGFTESRWYFTKQVICYCAFLNYPHVTVRADMPYGTVQQLSFFLHLFVPTKSVKCPTQCHPSNAEAGTLFTTTL